MNGDTNLVASLVDRLATRLPHRTGSSSLDLERDEIVALTRATLVNISRTYIRSVLEALLVLLEDLVRQYKVISLHPPHVLHTELYIIHLLGDCVCADWENTNITGSLNNGENTSENAYQLQEVSSRRSESKGFHNSVPKRSNPDRNRVALPEPLNDALMGRILELLKLFLPPITENYVPPASQLLDGNSFGHGVVDTSDVASSAGSQRDFPEDAFQVLHLEEAEADIRIIVEYLSASNWDFMLEHIKTTFRVLRTAYSQFSGNQNSIQTDDENHTLEDLRLIAFLWVDAGKLGQVVSELCGNFLYLRKPFQNTIAMVVPSLVIRWIDQNPQDFVDMHLVHSRIDAGVETLFDMTTGVDNARWRAVLQPFLISLLLLLPNVWEVASNMRETKSNSMSKKIAFLDSLRKALRNKNATALYSLASLLRAARHFDLNSDAALLSYALDVQDEVQESIFRKAAPGSELQVYDSRLVTAAIVSLAQLNFEICRDTVGPLCLAASTSQDLKLAYVSACCYLACQSNAEDYQSLFKRLSGFIQSHLKDLQSDRGFSPSMDNNANIKQSVTPGELTYLSFLFLNIRPLALFDGAPMIADDYDKFFHGTLVSVVTCLNVDDDRIRSLAGSVARKLMVDRFVFFPRGDSDPPTSLRDSFWKSTCTVLLTALDGLIVLDEQVKPVLSFVHDFLLSRLSLLKSSGDVSNLEAEAPERFTISVRLETIFLVSLCSPDIEICRMVTACIALLCEECRIFDSPYDPTKSPPTVMRNIEIYEELSSRDFRFTGLVAFQKRVWSLLRRMGRPSTGIVSAWEIGFGKWYELSRRLYSSRPGEVIEERTFVEWRNYSGFLAALAGSCISEQLAINDETGLAGLRWIDRSSQDGDDETLLDRYMSQSVQLLSCHNVRIREATREVLSTELSPGLYLILLKLLESDLMSVFDGLHNSTLRLTDTKVTFAEQAAALLRSIVERLDGPTEIGGTITIDIGALTLNFARYLNNISDSAHTVRIKIKVCLLCEVVTKKKELLNLRHDVRVRNQLLEILFGWVARPGSSRFESTIPPEASLLDELKLQRDLDRACLRALADLTYRLPLQPSDNQSDADTNDMKSQLFRTYFNRFLSLLHLDTGDGGKPEGQPILPSKDDMRVTPDLAISALSNLLSANLDVGLKHSLGIGYHEDPKIRTAFVKVLCNVLAQGTEFHSLSNSAVSERYDELIRLLVNDMTLTTTLCDACPTTEVDELTISLLNIFDSRGLGFALMQALIHHEVEETENEAELLRRNCVTTKMLSVYAKWKGATYLKSTLQKVLERLVVTAQDLDLELDPARVSTTEELQKNALQLRVVTKVFIDDICGSAEHIPVSFRKICSIISAAVMERFPEAKFTAVGAFIFLRFFCPAIVAPDAESLINTKPSKEMRRGLLLIAKIVQNLANNVLFGAKESYMFPLNDFLTQNIYRVTTFLREISVPPTIADTSTETESFDFGSSVALHNFLYDHWDQVRQKLLVRYRRDPRHSSPEPSKMQPSVIDALRTLVTNLGPPPTDITWNRPLISTNSPPSYSRFQDFMLRNAGRNNESARSARAVYDGGESKDGLSIICIVLRNIDGEGTNFDSLLFYYLKIASRMWHHPFGILVDATCYSGQNEPQDGLFKKLDLLTPCELSKSLSRIYVYNMNSAFRKCFRRILRLSAKNESSAFHPKNVDYHLLGSLQELQSHFHLSQLHLPKETISVVSDTRFVYQPVIRLSKTKGKIEVVIKVGSQFIQITTSKKQEVVPGLRLHATVNDIFRLAEVDEAPTSIQTEEDSAFGLRTESGKIVMYFMSPKKADVLQAIRSAKSKLGKDLKASKSFERVIRPQDVPGTLLNIAFANLASMDSQLRLSSYNLLCALCQTFKFAVDSKYLKSGDLCVPLNASTFIVDVSRQLAVSELQLANDFLNEFFVGWDSFPPPQRPLSLSYMAPWLPGLRNHVLATETDGEKSRDKIAIILRKLIEVALIDPTLEVTLGQCVWPTICRDEVQTDILLEELIRAALSFGRDYDQVDTIGSIITSLHTIVARGKIISKLRKALNRTSLRPSRSLPDNAVWEEICILLRLCLSTSFESAVQSQIYLPELFHIVTMLANTGSGETKQVVHKVLFNSIHALCTHFPLEETKLARLKAILISFSEPGNDVQVNMMGLVRNGLASLHLHDSRGLSLLSTEALANLLSEVSSIAAPSVDMSNTWRSRWMSLIASTAFQSNPAIQPRAFTVMGCLAREDVDDDLLYQMLVALKSTINRGIGDDDNEMLIAIVTSLTKMMEKLPTASRYGLQLFWLAVALVRLVPLDLYNCATSFIEAVLINISTSGELKNGRMVSVLLQGRVPVEGPAVQLDESYGIHFNSDNFHFAVCASLVKGFTDSVTKATTIRVLTTFLKIASSTTAAGREFPEDLSYLPYLGLIMSRTLNHDEVKNNLWFAGVNIDEASSSNDILSLIDLDKIKDKELLLNVAISIIGFRYLEDIVQDRGLLWLNKVAIRRPTVMLHLCDTVFSILDQILLSCQNVTTLNSAHVLLRTLTSDPKLAGRVDTTQLLEEVLEDIGFIGLWRSSTFHTADEQDRKRSAIIDRMIELIIA